jgi:integrase
MTVSARQQFVSTTSEPDHLSALAELLLVDALDQAGFIFHDLPLDPTARRTNALPDVMGTMPGLGSVCMEVYQPRDELARAAYAEELHDAVELADLPAGYVSGLSWSSSQGVGGLPGARVRHQRIASWLAGLAELVRSVPRGDEVEAVFRDDEAGITCDVRLTAIEAWDDPDQRPYRQTVGSWGEMWSMPAHAASVASRLESKGNKRQAVSRLADQRLLIVDCSAMQSFWDLAISPHGPSIDVMCDALEERRDSIMRGLDGLIMWAPYIPAGELRRVVLAAEETSCTVTGALAGVAWEPTAARVHESSGYLLEAHVIPALGGYKLSKLRPADLQRYYAAQLDLSRAPSSVRKDHNYLHSACKHAVMMQLLVTNPADFVVPPRIVRSEMKVLDEGQAAAMLHAAEGTSLHMALLLAIGTGMRRGELLGLRWGDVDLEAATAAVNQTLQEAYGKIVFKEPKTAKSRRRITLPGVVVDALRAHRAEQARKTLAHEPNWTDSAFVLAAPHGGPWRPSNFDTIWRRFKTKQKLEIRFHDLRHTHATQLLKVGVHPKVVSERLGHASIAITLDVYSHVLPGMQEAAAELIDAGLRAALAG